MDLDVQELAPAPAPPKSEADEDKQAYARVKHSALRMLAAREHSAQELQRKLVAKGHDADRVAQVLDELRQQNLQSDERFAEGYVRARTAKGFGPMRIRQGLFERGIGDELVDAHLTHCAEHWLDLAGRALAKRYQSAEVVDRNEWNRRARFLAGRGYPADIIYRVMDQG